MTGRAGNSITSPVHLGLLFVLCPQMDQILAGREQLKV